VEADRLRRRGRRGAASVEEIRRVREKFSSEITRMMNAKIHPTAAA
jgi:hypothetical protein